jgi:hypothetical protein
MSTSIRPVENEVARGDDVSWLRIVSSDGFLLGV